MGISVRRPCNWDSVRRPISPEQYQDRLRERAQVLDLESLKVNSKYVVEDLQPVYCAIREHYEPGRTVVVSQSFLIGAREAQEELDFPLETVLHIIAI